MLPYHDTEITVGTTFFSKDDPQVIYTFEEGRDEDHINVTWIDKDGKHTMYYTKVFAQECIYYSVWIINS